MSRHAGFLLAWLAWAPVAWAHDLQYTVTGGQAVVVKLFYADNTAFSFEGYEIYPEGMALSFGKSSFSYGVTATKQVSDNATIVFEAGQIRFQKYHYDPDPVGGNPTGIRVKFGTETRLNAALSYRMMTNPESRFRLDGNLELNFLRLGRDVEDGVPAPATGGDILYGVLGARLYKDNMSLGLAVKKPVWTDLNESALQQGAEGKEKYRLIATFSALF